MEVVVANTHPDESLYYMIYPGFIDAFEEYVLKYYCDISEGRNSIPLLKSSAFQNDEEIDYWNEFWSFMHQSLKFHFMEHDDNYPDKEEDWTEDCDEHIDNQLCEGTYFYEECLLEDIETVFNKYQVAFCKFEDQYRWGQKCDEEDLLSLPLEIKNAAINGVW